MNTHQKRQGFFILYFTNFKAMFIGNILFSAVLIIFGATVYGVASLLKMTENIWFLGIVIPLVYPFFSGVTQITKDVMNSHKKTVFAWQSFKKGLKNNIRYFALYGVVLYLIFIVSYYSIIFYYKMALMEWVFYIPLFVAVVIALFFLFMSFSLPVLTVTLDLKLKYYLKNAALMAIGELPMNFYVLITSFVLVSACFTVSLLMPYPLLGILVVVISLFLLLPTGLSYCSVYRLYPKIEDVFDIENKEKNKDFPLKPTQIVPTDDDGNPIETDYTTVSDNEGYVFVNGMLIKKSQMKNEES